VKLKDTLERIKSKDCSIQIFGLGYVGFPLSVRLAKSGFSVIGIDTDQKKIESLKNKILLGSQMTLKNEFLESVQVGKFVPSVNPIKSEKPNIAIICVPTPISDDNKDSNVYVNLAVERFLEVSKPGDVLILESSVDIGTTDEIKQKVESKGFHVGEDFGISFCPERIDPLNKKWKLENIPRIIYSSDDTTFQISEFVYKNVNNSNLTRVKSSKTAELVKSFENSFRLVNISLVNELAILCDKLGINVREVIDAASTKPFGFMPFYPGAGAGGHCIPKDSRFLLDSAKKIGLKFDSIEKAVTINSMIPKYIVKSIENTLSELKLKKSVIVCGLSYKPDIEDMRDSPGFRILKELESGGFKATVYDPYFKNELREKYLIENNIQNQDFDKIDDLSDKSINGFNCLCLVQNHSKNKLRIEEIYKNSLIPMIYDCQNGVEFDLNSKTVLKSLGGYN